MSKKRRTRKKTTARRAKTTAAQRHAAARRRSRLKLAAETGYLKPYWSVIIPHVPAPYRTQWHPTESTGPFRELSRGAFRTQVEAIRWAQSHLDGTPYSLQKY